MLEMFGTCTSTYMCVFCFCTDYLLYRLFKCILAVIVTKYILAVISITAIVVSTS